MGAFGTGFLGSIGDAVHQKAALARANEQKQKDMEAQYHWEALKARLAQGGTVDPTTGQFKAFTPDDRDKLVQDATDNMAKAYGGSKPVKEIMQRAQQLIGKATGHALWGHPGSENIQKDATTPAAAATPTASQASATGIPAPPGLQAQAAAPALDSSSASDAAPTNMLGSASASDAAPAVSSPTSALASASQGLSDGKSASSVDLSGASSGPSDVDQSQNQQVAPQPSSDATAVARGTTLSPPPSSKAATAAVAPQGLSPAAAATPSPGPAAGIAPPPGVPPAAAGVASWNPTGHQLMNSFISPYDTARLQAESQNAIDLRNKQAIFEQQQAQLKKHLANLAEAKGSPLTPTETMLAAGVKLPTAMFVPHYGGKVVLGEHSFGVMTDGSSSSDHVGQTLQQVGQNGEGLPVYNRVDIPTRRAVSGNQMHVYNGLTNEDLGVTSQDPVKLPTTSGTIAPMTGMMNGQAVRLAGSRTSTPGTGNAPLATSGGATANTPLPAPGNQPPTSPSALPPNPATGGVPPPPRSAKPSTKPSKNTMAASGSMSGMPAGASVMPRGFVPMGQATAQQKMYAAVMDPYVQLFGDPDVPGIPPMSSYARLADNKEAANKVGSAINLSMQALDEEGEKGGGLLKVFTNNAGLPSIQASSHAKAINDSIEAMTPLEREAYDREMQMIGTLVGMRAITSASGGRWSVQNIKNEAPLLGINVADSKEFNRRLAGFAQQMYTASGKASIFSDADRNKFKGEAQNLAKLGYGALNPPPKGKADGPPVQAAPQHKIQVGNKFYLYKGNGDTGDLSNYSEVPK